MTIAGTTACNGSTTACYNGGAGAPNCAKKTIQAGIDATQANGDEVVVANGTYKGHTSASSRNRDIRFTKWGNGDPRLITVRSANGAANCIIDCDDDGDGEGEGRAFDFDHANVGFSTRAAIVGTPESTDGAPDGKGFTIKNGKRTTGARRARPSVIVFSKITMVARTAARSTSLRRRIR